MPAPINEKEISDYLHIINQDRGNDWLTEIRAITRDKTHIARVTPETIPGVISSLRSFTRDLVNVCPQELRGNIERVKNMPNFRRDPETRRYVPEHSIAADIVARRWLVVDIDVHKLPGEWAKEGDKRDALDWLLSTFDRPHMVVGSGNGLHCYYRLQRAESCKYADILTRDILASLQKRNLDRDTWDVDTQAYSPIALFRLPGMWNNKIPNDPRPIVIIDQSNAGAEPYLLEDLAALLNPDLPDNAQRQAEAWATTRTVDLSGLPPEDERAERAVKYLEKMPAAVGGQRGHSACYAAACALVHGLALPEQLAFDILKEHYNPKCTPQWSDGELWHKINDAAVHDHQRAYGYIATQEPPKRKRRDRYAEYDGVDVSILFPPREPVVPPELAREVEAVEVVATEQAPDAPTPKAIEADYTEFDDPRRIARFIMDRYADLQRRLLLRFWRDDWYHWSHGYYHRLERGSFRSMVWGLTDAYFDYVTSLIRAEYAKDPGEKKPPTRPKVTTALVANVIGSLESQCLLQIKDSPSWITPGSNHTSPKLLVSTPHTIVDVVKYATDRVNSIAPSTPELFSTAAVDYEITTTPGPTTEWDKFLTSVWGDDSESKLLLQQWMGYLLTNDNRYQKMLMLVGPPRAGKGVIAGVIRQLVGDSSCCAFSISSMAKDFVLQSMIGKSVAIDEDARLDPKASSAIISSRMLTISGGGTIYSDRKNKEALSINLGVRFVMASNEILKISDDSSAFHKRWSILTFMRSFMDKEDHGLEERLRRELPGIFAWACEGLRHLHATKRFVVPTISIAQHELLKNSGSNVGPFIAEWCYLHPEHSTPCNELWDKWVEWSDLNGNKPGARSDFARKLFAAAPGVRKARVRDSIGQRPWHYTGILLRLESDGDAVTDQDESDTDNSFTAF